MSRGARRSTSGPPSIRPVTEAVAALSRDEHWLFFTSDRPGGWGQRHLGLVSPARARPVRLATRGEPRCRRQFGLQRGRAQLLRERRHRCAAALLPQRSTGWPRRRPISMSASSSRTGRSARRAWSPSSAARDTSNIHRSGSTGWRCSSSRIGLADSEPSTCGSATRATCSIPGPRRRTWARS